MSAPRALTDGQLIREFVSKAAAQIAQFRGDPGSPSVGHRLLLAGNGLTRLAVGSMSWRQWIREAWNAADALPFPLEYAELRGLTLPECLSLLIESLGATGSRRVYDRLWNATEHPRSVDIDLSLHELCIRQFGTIVTTNYDTLFERAAIHGSTKLPFRVSVVKSNGQLAHKNYPPDRPPQRTIVKLHGTFPFNSALKAEDHPLLDETLASWNPNSEVIATASEYDEGINACLAGVAELASGLENDVQAVVALGYGMAAEDRLVSHFLRMLGPGKTKLSMTYAGDEVDQARISACNADSSL